MGKITLTEAENLVKQGTLSKKAFEKMQKDGLVGTRKRGEKRYIKTKEILGYLLSSIIKGLMVKQKVKE